MTASTSTNRFYSLELIVSYSPSLLDTPIRGATVLNGANGRLQARSRSFDESLQVLWERPRLDQHTGVLQAWQTHFHGPRLSRADPSRTVTICDRLEAVPTGKWTLDQNWQQNQNLRSLLTLKSMNNIASQFYPVRNQFFPRNWKLGKNSFHRHILH